MPAWFPSTLPAKVSFCLIFRYAFDYIINQILGDVTSGMSISGMSEKLKGKNRGLGDCHVA